MANFEHEEAEELRAEVIADDLDLLNNRYILEFPEDIAIERFLRIVSLPTADDNNMFLCAIRNQSYMCVQTILEIFRNNAHEGQYYHILTALDAHRNNCLQVLLANSIGQTDDRISYIENICVMLITVPDLAEELNAVDSGFLAQAIKVKLYRFYEELMKILNVQQKLMAIQQTEGCNERCLNNQHNEECKNGYNHLMLALDNQNPPMPLINRLLNFLNNHIAVGYIVVVGTNDPQTYTNAPNSLRLAAERGRGKIVIHMLRKCVPDSRHFDALLEVGPGGSALEHMLKKQKISTLKRLFGGANVNDMKSSLQNPSRRKNLLKLKMRLAAIKLFYDYGMFEDKFLIPRPSHLSQPLSINFYNKFEEPNELRDARNEIESLETALVDLGWDEENIFCNDGDWTFYQLTTLLKRKLNEKKYTCSLLLLCISSHGEAGCIQGAPNEENDELTIGYIDDIIEITAKLEAHIPKVLIFDSCRIQPEDPNETTRMHELLEANNILLLSSTVFGGEADMMAYLPELAKAIQASDGQTSLQEMHQIAAEQVKRLSDPPQIPQLQSTARNIMMRPYAEENECLYCKEDMEGYQEGRLICPHCLRWYHRICVTDDAMREELAVINGESRLCIRCMEKHSRP